MPGGPCCESIVTVSPQSPSLARLAEVPPLLLAALFGPMPDAVLDGLRKALHGATASPAATAAAHGQGVPRRDLERRGHLLLETVLKFGERQVLPAGSFLTAEAKKPKEPEVGQALAATRNIATVLGRTGGTRPVVVHSGRRSSNRRRLAPRRSRGALVKEPMNAKKPARKPTKKAKKPPSRSPKKAPKPPVRKAEKPQQSVRKTATTTPATKPTKGLIATRANIATSWERVTRWHEAHGVLKFQLAPGASKAQLAEAELALGIQLPDDVRISWELHNGGLTDSAWILTYGDLLPIDRVVAQWNTYLEWQEDDGWGLEEDMKPTNIAGAIKPIWWNPRRIAVTDNSGNGLHLDLDPPTDGVSGQVIFLDHEVGPTVVLAKSWSAFLEQWADELEAGKYVYSPKHEVVALPGAYSEPPARRRFVQRSSEKVWEIGLADDTILTVDVMSDGGSMSQQFTPGAGIADATTRAAHAKKEYDALIAEKAEEGYVEEPR